VLTATAADSRSVYGPLAAPIAVLLWLYLVSIAVLIGAAVNAACDTIFPQNSTQRARTELMRRLTEVLPLPQKLSDRLTGEQPAARPAEPPRKPGSSVPD
jgi:membrane protein